MKELAKIEGREANKLLKEGQPKKRKQASSSIGSSSTPSAKRTATAGSANEEAK